MQRYTTPAIIFHWLIAILIVCAFTVGLIMADMPVSPTKLKIVNYHKWTGVTILGLAALRLLWRLAHRPPSYPASMPEWQQNAAHGLHWGLYALMFAVPISGYCYSLAAGFPIVYLGVIELPVLFERNAELKPILKEVHFWLNMLLAGAVGGHIMAAVKHAVVDKDGILQRMLPTKE